MIKKLFVFWMLSLLMLSGNSQQSKVIDRIIEIGRTDNRTMHHLDVITNRFGGRPVVQMPIRMQPSGALPNSGNGAWKL